MLGPPCVCAGGVDGSGGAGLAADAAALRRLGCAPWLVKTAWAEQGAGGLRAWTSAAPAALAAALRASCSAHPAAPVKTGMLGGRAALAAAAEVLAGHPGPVVVDPVTGPSAGGSWIEDGWREDFLAAMPAIATVITPNLAEARWLSGLEDAGAGACLAALRELGFKNIIVTGGDGDGEDRCVDLVGLAGTDPYPLAGPRAAGVLRGTGCSHASSLAGALALGHGLADAAVLARLGTVARIEGQEGFPAAAAMPSCGTALPVPPAGAARLEEPMGICPVVESAARIPSLAAAGARWAQLRCKSADRGYIEAEISKAAALARASGLRLIVNDHWACCCRREAGFVAGVHLGQEDLRSADVAAIHRKGLLLGVSAHGYAEAARALAAAPGYVSFGPVHPTMSKVLAHPTLGIEGFARLCRGLPVPAIAIGGVKPATIPALAAAGAAGAAAIAAAATADGLRSLCAAWDEAVAGDGAGPGQEERG